MFGKRRSGKARTDLEAVLEGFPPPSLILPVRAMESVLALGQAAVPDLLSALSRWKEDEDRDLFPIVVLLGELGHADAVGPLVEIIETPEDFFLGEAAAEALARIGAPSVPLLKRLAREGEALERLFAFGALGEIRAEGTYQFLLEALEKDLELAGVISGGVASQGGAQAVPALVRALERCPAWQRRELEANIRLAHGLEPRSTRLTEDWRLRYRVLPRLGIPRPGVLVISAFLLEAGEEMRGPSSHPVRPLEEILADPSGDERGLCEDCGKALEAHTGIPVCPDDAVFVSFLQHRLLEKARDEYDEEDIFGLLEALETEALWLEDEDDLDYPGELDELELGEEELEQEEEELEQEKEDVGLVIQTCRWLVEQGVEDVGAGPALLLAHAGKLADRFGDPHGLLSSTRPGRSGFKPGRNDPCPCGSGQKYKKCCGKAEPANLRLMERRPVAETGPWGPADVYEDPRGPESRLYGQLFTDMLRMARRSMARPEQEQALVRFLGPGFRGLSMESAVERMDPMWAGECFFEWLVCDFRRRSGRTPLEWFVERKGRTLDALSRVLLERASSTFMSLYRIEEVRPGEGATLKDLFLGERVEVEERFATRQLVRWDLIATRLMEMDGARRITGGIIPFPARNKDAVMEALEEEHARFLAVRPEASKEEFLKEKGEVLYRIARQRLDAPLPSLLTSDGDPVAFCRARYHIREPEGLAGKMESIPGMEAMEAEEGPEPFFRWVEPLTEGAAPGPNAGAQAAGSGESLVITSTLGSSRSLGSIEISEDRLVLECMSEARLARGRALLEEHLSGAIIHRADTVRDPWQAMAERKEEDGPRERRTPQGIPPEVERGLVQDFMDQHVRSWVDEAVPALNGLSPREAVAQKGGRSRVAELIRQMEHGQAMQQREKGFAYDTAWLWEELGLDPAED